MRQQPEGLHWCVVRTVRRESDMATYIYLTKWTEHGIKNARETVERGKQAEALAQRMGGRVTNLLWTQGAYDVIGQAEFPDDETASAFALALSMGGAVQTQTLRAYSSDEMGRILQKLPQGQ